MNVLPMTESMPANAAGAGNSQTNFVGLDALRVFAALAVVVLHALVPYLKHPMPGLVWSVTDSTSSTADGIFWSIELFVMPLFLLVAGFLTQQSWLRRRSGSGLIRSRARRLLRPLLFAMVVILPIDLYIWVIGWISEGLVSPIKLKSLKFDPSLSKHLWGLSHLWFLHYLFSYVLVFAGFRTIADRCARLPVIRFQHPVLRRMNLGMSGWIFVFWLVAASVIFFRPEVIWGFQHAFAPVASKWIYNGCFFAMGAVLASFDPDALKLKAVPSVGSLAAVCVLLMTVPLGVWSLKDASDVTRSSSMVLAIMTAASSLLVSVVLISECLRRFRRLPRWMNYLAAASFWIYLAHHPVLALVHIDLKWMLPSASPMFKATLATLSAVTVSLLTYECFVRRTRLGQWLGMTWSPDQSLPRDSHDSPTVKPNDDKPVRLRIRRDDQDSPIRRAA